MLFAPILESFFKIEQGKQQGGCRLSLRRRESYCRVSAVAQVGGSGKTQATHSPFPVAHGLEVGEVFDNFSGPRQTALGRRRDRKRKIFSLKTQARTGSMLELSG